ncbi:MAG: hypothetical protein ACTSYT_03060 [Candidatus Asgardarchaeia archaeon]
MDGSLKDPHAAYRNLSSHVENFHALAGRGGQLTEAPCFKEKKKRG